MTPSYPKKIEILIWNGQYHIIWNDSHFNSKSRDIFIAFTKKANNMIKLFHQNFNIGITTIAISKKKKKIEEN